MKKSELFKQAHALTNSVIQPNDNYQATFALCLKYVYSTIKIEIVNHERSGSKHYLTMVGITENKIRESGEWLNHFGSILKDKNGNLVVECINKKMLSNFKYLIDSLNTKKTTTNSPKEQTNQPKKSRYIELLNIAQRDGLNHGKSWFCTAYNVDSMSLPPHFEGEMICYVYPAK